MNRLAVLDRGVLRVHDVDRGTSATLSSSDAANRQPTWSPDGRLLAWSRFDRRDADAHARVVVAEVGRSARRELDIVFPAFYLHWRPDSGALAALGEGPLGLELTLLDLATGDSSIAARGAPLYFDWSASGSLVVHVGIGAERRLERHGGPGATAAAPCPLPAPSAFTAPAVRNGTDQTFAAVRRDGASLLVLLDRHGETTTRIAAFAGTARFTVSGDGRRVAYVAMPDADGTDARSFAPDVRPAVAGELVVHDVAGDSAVSIGPHAPVAFEWSPDGRHLAFLAPVEVGSARWFRWHVWSDGELRELDWCRPSVVEAREYLPFAEQFTRSHRRWSPDSRRFCYAGTATDGSDGVWIASLDGGTQRLCAGQAAVWSP
jgi:Tol biopolymer transport system component